MTEAAVPLKYIRTKSEKMIYTVTYSVMTSEIKFIF